jgi:hypothetical protein
MRWGELTHDGKTQPGVLREAGPEFRLVASKGLSATDTMQAFVTPTETTYYTYGFNGELVAENHETADGTRTATEYYYLDGRLIASEPVGGGRYYPRTSAAAQSHIQGAERRLWQSRRPSSFGPSMSMPRLRHNKRERREFLY